MPPPRFTVKRANIDQRYSVWDNEKGKAAVSGSRECVDLNFDDAFKLADGLNAENIRPKKK
jgi:hypothetical protein